MLIGENGRHYVVEGAGDMRTWSILFEGTSQSDVTDIVELRVGSDKAEGGRFYRARMYLGNTIEEQIGGAQVGQ